MRLLSIFVAACMATKKPHQQAFHADLPESHQNEEQEKVLNVNFEKSLCSGCSKNCPKVLWEVFKWQ